MNKNFNNNTELTYNEVKSVLAQKQMKKQNIDEFALEKSINKNKNDLKNISSDNNGDNKDNDYIPREINRI